MRDAAPDNRSSFVMGLGAYAIWGFLPLYFHALRMVSSFEMVAQRILWSLLLISLIMVVMRRSGAILETLRQPRIVLALSGSAAFIAGNWLVYIWAVNNDHVVAASLGYFLNPLINVMLGVIVLRERLAPTQIVAIALAAIGVLILAVGELSTLWISLVLATSFAIYGLIRKMTPVASPIGLCVETMILAPFALGWMAWTFMHSPASLAHTPALYALIAASGVVTSVPLIMFASAARKLPMVTLGLMQYVAPTIQFLLGVFAFHEALSPGRWASFVLIWIGLALFAGHALHNARAKRALAPARVV